MIVYFLPSFLPSSTSLSFLFPFLYLHHLHYPKYHIPLLLLLFLLHFLFRLLLLLFPFLLFFLASFFLFYLILLQPHFPSSAFFLLLNLHPSFPSSPPSPLSLLNHSSLPHHSVPYFLLVISIFSYFLLSSFFLSLNFPGARNCAIKLWAACNGQQNTVDILLGIWGSQFVNVGVSVPEIWRHVVYTDMHFGDKWCLHLQDRILILWNYEQPFSTYLTSHIWYIGSFPSSFLLIWYRISDT